MDSVDKVIWILPVLAVFDVVSTLYTESLDASDLYHEVGFFASYFVDAGLVYAYIPLYVLCIIGISWVLWYIKNRKLNPSYKTDKVVFLLLVGATWFIYMSITAAFIVNLFLPSIVGRGVDLFYIQVLIYVTAGISLGMFVWQDVVAWVRAGSVEKE